MINIGNGNKIINSIVKENEMKTTYLYENGKKVVFNDQHILDYVNGGKENWKRHFIGCAIVLAGIFTGVYLSARQEIDQVDHFILFDKQDTYHRFDLHNEPEDVIVTGRDVPKPINPMPVHEYFQ